MEPLSVPFTHRSWIRSYQAMLTVRGVLCTEPGGLVLEYSAVENYFEVKPTVETGIRTVAIPWTEIQSLTYRPRFFGWGSLVLRTRSLRALDGVPNARGSEVPLSISRADRLTARELAASVELALAERRLDALDAPASRASLPPG
jgi:hypothetical protein